MNPAAPTQPDVPPGTPTDEAATAAFQPGAADADAGGKVADKAHQALATARSSVRANPWVALGAAVAAGAALGFFIKK